MSVTLHIQRGADVPETFEVAYREGMSILDALKQVGHDTPDLAYRWECGQGICGVCTLTINGSPALACTTLINPDETYSLSPLAGFPVEKDLLVNFQVRLEKMLEIKPYLIDGGKPIETKAEADSSKGLRACIESWACVAVCPVSLNTGSADALSIVKLARFALDPRDGADRAQIAREHGLDLYTKVCPTCRACMDICPKGIDVYADAVQVLNRKAQSEHEQR